jgi:N6-adenosine-specific RNA methylase IME4
MEPIRTIVADPAWSYTDKKAGMKKTGKGAASHYQCLSVEQIKNFLCETPAPDTFTAIAHVLADNAHLWLWVTNAFLVDGTGPAVCRAWGFEPKTIITWVKGRVDRKPHEEKARLIQHIGQGSYLRNSTEHVIFAVRGKCPPAVRNLPTSFVAPEPGSEFITDEVDILTTAFVSPRTEHSQKPDLILEWAEQLSPAPYLELFARRRRAGWLSIGDELPAVEEQQIA